jgi:hypothetical protein
MIIIFEISTRHYISPKAEITTKRTFEKVSPAVTDLNWLISISIKEKRETDLLQSFIPLMYFFHFALKSRKE